MLRTLRAFTWMRWRVLMNSLERTGSRDTLERFSLAIEQIGPTIALLALVPSSIVLFGFGAYAGYQLPRGEVSVAFEAFYFFSFGFCIFAIVGPLFMPSIERTSAVRLLLLPIPRTTLYLTQAASALSEPWVLLPMPVLAGVAAGLAARGALVGAAVAAIGGLLMLLVLVHLSVLSALVFQLLVRDRRRGELLALLFVIVMPIIGFLPGLLQGERRHRDTSPPQRVEDQNDSAESVARWAARAGRYAAAVAPPTQYSRATRTAAGGRNLWTETGTLPLDGGGIALPLLALTGWVAALHGLGVLTFGRLLDAPASTGRRQAVSSRAWTPRVPGLSRAAIAVAQAQLRLAFRTPRGRSILLSPVMASLMFGLFMSRSGNAELGFLNLSSGFALAIMGCAISLLAILPIAMNQFAVDRAGLTLDLLLPLTTRDLLWGKAIGNGLIAAVPAVVSTIGAYAVSRQGDIPMWLGLAPAAISCYVLTAPVAAALSAIFPRAVDLNSIGRGSNAHGFAALLGLITIVATAAPSALLMFGLRAFLQRPVLTLVLLVIWCGVALGISLLLLEAVATVVDRRRENLGLVV